MKLDDLIKRGDVCLFCGYTIGIAGETKCPECGRERPTAEEVARVRRAVKIGKAGVICVGIALAWLGFLVLLASLETNVPFAIIGIILYVVFLAFMAVMLGTWVYEVRRTRPLFRSAWRRAFVAAYPWVLLLGVFVLMVTGWSQSA